MTFADKLRELRERATSGYSIVNGEKSGVSATDVSSFLLDHAAEIEKLVRAAEKADAALNYAMSKQSEPYHWEMMRGTDPHKLIQTSRELESALAALNNPGKKTDTARKGRE
jgi:uncharacterized protein YycO